MRKKAANTRRKRVAKMQELDDNRLLPGANIKLHKKTMVIEIHSLVERRRKPNATTKEHKYRKTRRSTVTEFSV